MNSLMYTVVVCFLCIAPTASQLGARSFSYPAKFVATDGQECPTEEEWAAAREDVLLDIRSRLNDDGVTLPIPGVSQQYPAESCRQLAELRPQSPSGYYWVRSSNGTAVQTYCDMSRICCNTTGGWARIAYLNMTDPSHHCPPAWNEINGTKRMCGQIKPGIFTTCNPVYFNSQGLYTRICGRIIAYQFGYTEAFLHYNVFPGSNSIDSFFFDGISVTRGNPRQHVWTFATALAEGSTGISVCPCTNTANTATINIPPFVGQDYFCETGTANVPNLGSLVVYDDDPLWDGQGCGPTSTCCEFNNPPWFCKELPETTVDNIEIRLCEGHGPDQADTRIELIEIYVQ